MRRASSFQQSHIVLFDVDHEGTAYEPSLLSFGCVLTGPCSIIIKALVSLVQLDKPVISCIVRIVDLSKCLMCIPALAMLLLPKQFSNDGHDSRPPDSRNGAINHWRTGAIVLINALAMHWSSRVLRKDASRYH